MIVQNKHIQTNVFFKKGQLQLRLYQHQETVCTTSVDCYCTASNHKFLKRINQKTIENHCSRLYHKDIIVTLVCLNNATTNLLIKHLQIGKSLVDTLTVTIFINYV